MRVTGVTGGIAGGEEIHVREEIGPEKKCNHSGQMNKER